MTVREVRFIPRPEQFSWTFGGSEPVLSIGPGDVLTLFTEDAFGGRITSTEDVPTERASAPFLNPQTGPFLVDGAEPGDTLAVHIISVRPARDWGVSTTSPLFGALVGTRHTANLQPDLPERTWIYRVDREVDELIYRANDSDFETRLPLRPFLGTIAVAPAFNEVRSTLVPDTFGGNMDSAAVCAGTTVYLGVNVPGALLSVGDGHYTMGDGEACGVAVEGAMDVELTVDVLKATSCPWPRFESDDSIMVAGSARPLEDAFRIAHAELVRWIMAGARLSLLDAYQLVSQGSHSQIANVCDPNYTVVAQFPKRLLPPQTDWMNGTHERLQSIAAGRSVRS